MYKDKNSPKFDVENTKYPRGKHYVRIDKAVQNEIITLQPVSSIYRGFNSCLVPSKVDYTTLDFYETVSTNHRKNINNEYQTQDSSNLQIIEAIIVPHSHNDPGWINTFEGHYTQQSKHILSNMVAKMSKYKEMTFVWAEMVLFSKWWMEITEEERQQTRQLIKEGRLEIMGGGWVVPDEATTHYKALVNNFLEGHLWLKKHLNYTPSTSWSLDPFGYSAFLPHLYKKIELKNTILLRVHTELKNLMVEEKLLHFNWRPVWSSRSGVDDVGNDVNTMMLPYRLYSIKFQCGPDNQVCLQFDFRDIAGEFSESVAVPVSNSNIYQLSSLLTQQLRKKANLQRHNGVVMFPIGDDFRFDRALEWDQQYSNYIKLINFINSRSELFNMTLRFGTVNDFFNILNREQENEKLPTLSGDFFPYADNPSDYWTGYYTSRIWLKKSIRMLESLVHAAEIIHTKTIFLSSKNPQNTKDSKAYLETIEFLLTQVRSNVSLLQHHDAITGTSTVPATNDFYKRSIDALAQTEMIMRQSFLHTLNSLTSTQQSQEYAQFRIFSESLNRDSRKSLLVDSDLTNVVIFNPLLSTYSEPITIRVETNYILSSTAVEPLYIHVQKYVLEGRNLLKKSIDCVVVGTNITKRTYFLHFTDNLAPLSYQYYKLFASSNDQHSCQPEYQAKENTDVNNHNLYGPNKFASSKNDKGDLVSFRKKDFVINLNCLKLYFNKITGNLLRVKLPNVPIQMLNVRFYTYTANGDGPYLFKPYKPAVEIWNKTPNRVKVTRSMLYYWVEVKMDALLTVKYKIPVEEKCSGGAVVDVEVTTNMQEELNLNQEIVMRVITKIKSGFIFFTDSNGFNAMLRKRMPSLDIPANYYPATSYAFIETNGIMKALKNKSTTKRADEKHRLTLLMSEPHGVSSLSSGELEVMLDRMTSYDDGKGVSGGVFDNKVVTVNFKLLLDTFERENIHESPTHDTNSTNSVSESMHTSMRNPTLDSHLAVDQMRHKPIVAATTSLSNHHISQLLNNDRVIDASKVPCDVALTSTRHLHKYEKSLEDSQHISTYLALHRFSWQAGFYVSTFDHLHHKYGCKLGSIASRVTAPSPLSGSQHFTNCDLHIADIFPVSEKIISVTSASLTLLYRKQKIDPHQGVCLNASSLNAYLLLSEPNNGN